MTACGNEKGRIYSMEKALKWDCNHSYSYGSQRENRKPPISSLLDSSSLFLSLNLPHTLWLFLYSSNPYNVKKMQAGTEKHGMWFQHQFNGFSSPQFPAATCSFTLHRLPPLCSSYLWLIPTQTAEKTMLLKGLTFGPQTGFWLAKKLDGIPPNT